MANRLACVGGREPDGVVAGRSNGHLLHDLGGIDGIGRSKAAVLEVGLLEVIEKLGFGHVRRALLHIGLTPRSLSNVLDAPVLHVVMQILVDLVHERLVRGNVAHLFQYSQIRVHLFNGHLIGYQGVQQRHDIVDGERVGEEGFGVGFRCFCFGFSV